MAKTEDKDTSKIPAYLDFLNKIDPREMQEVISAVSQEVPMFTVEDLRTTSQPLAQIARLFLIKKGVTKERFDFLFKQYAQDTYMSTQDMTSNRNNMRRSLHQPAMTYRTLERLLLICKFAVVDLAVTVRNQETGEVITLALDDVRHMVDRSPFKSSINIEDKDEK